MNDNETMKHDLRLHCGACMRTARLLLSIFGLTLFLAACAGVVATQNSGKQLAALKDAESYYLSGDTQRAEQLVKKLIGTKSNADGSATVLLARIYREEEQYQKALDLLRHHEALVALYKEAPPGDPKEIGREWSNEKKVLYGELKTLHGRLRFHLGQKDESVLEDLLAGISSYHTVSYIPDGESLQFSALIYFSSGRYEKAIFYWNQLLTRPGAAESIAEKNETKESEGIKDFYHATEYNIACAYAKLGNVDQTLSWLRKSLVHKPKERLQSILTDHDLDNVREDSRFKDFIRGLQGGRFAAPNQ